MDKKIEKPRLDPDQVKITGNRAKYLAKLTGIDVKKLQDKKISEVNDLIKWRVDPSLLLFRRICGRVVKRDADGSLCPVPGATVHVQDTDCSFLGFFPTEPPFFWLWPIKCQREEIATVTTDACGNFCVYLPYWDIDRMLRFRRERICFGDIFRPTLRDIPELLPEPPEIRIPRPQPDPLPIRLFTPEVIEQVRTFFGSNMAEAVSAKVADKALGDSAIEYNDLLSTPLPSSPPPLSDAFMQRDKPMLEEVAESVGIDRDILRALDYKRYLGPFIACRDIWRLEWVPFLDIPDITFRVTQDVDADGSEEEIYSEGFFDVRWNMGPYYYTTLVADASAICTHHCEPVQEFPCEGVPKISTVGYMTLEDSHHDNTTGYGRRVNRPVPAPGNYPPPPADGAGPNNAVSPYARTLNLHGCHRIGDATHYRLTYTVNGVGSPVPFTDISWWAPKSASASGPPILVASDANGWYPILAANLLEHPSWLLYWNTRRFANGTYEVRVETGKLSSGTISVLATSAPVKFVIDNADPEASFVWVRWRYADVVGPWDSTHSTLLPSVCPVIKRDPTRNIRIMIRWKATADHLRDAYLNFTGCGAGLPVRVNPDIEAYRHWHMNAFDNTIMQNNEWEIPASRPAGCYTLWVRSMSRAFNPSGFDHGPGNDWYINQGLIYRWIHRAISVVDK